MAQGTDVAVRAAFFRVEGALVRAPALKSAAWFTLNAQEVPGRVTRLGGVALATGLMLAGSLGEQQLVQRAAWMGLRGMSADRVAFLGEEYFDEAVPRFRASPYGGYKGGKGKSKGRGKQKGYGKCTQSFAGGRGFGKSGKGGRKGKGKKGDWY